MDQRTGVTLVKPEQCDECYRLYSSRGTETACLIAADGRELHRWSYPQEWSWHYAEILPNGHLVAIVKDVMILELDWNSKLVWKAEVKAHHDFARLPNGNTLVAIIRDEAHPWQENARLKLDSIIELTPDSRQVWEWRAEAHADEIAQHVSLRIPPPENFRDWPHINTVEVLPDGPTARKDARFKAGNILFCGRHIDTIGVIDRKTDRVIWAWGPGKLLGPHMPTMLPNGHLLIYDNGQNASVEVRKWTRIIELDPLTEKIVWEFKADPPESFYSPARGSSQRLANGNTLIAESDPGRLLEVTREGEIVWEFLCPDFHQNGSRMSLYRAVAYEREFIDRLMMEKDGRD